MSEKNRNKISEKSVANSFIDNMVHLRAYLSRFFSSQHDIEDVLQDTYIKAVEAENKTTIQAPKAFLYKVSKNLAINHHSRAAQKLTDSVADLDQLAVLLESISLEDQFEQQARFTEFCQSVKKLPPKCRKVFILKKVYGLSNSEIAKRLDIAISTVDKHLAKGLLLCKHDLRNKGIEFEKSARRPLKQQG